MLIASHVLYLLKSPHALSVVSSQCGARNIHRQAWPPSVWHRNVLGSGVPQNE